MANNSHLSFIFLFTRSSVWMLQLYLLLFQATNKNKKVFNIDFYWRRRHTVNITRRKSVNLDFDKRTHFI